MSSRVEDINGFAASIDKANSIIITSHLFPDYDAVCSSLLLARALRYNYPEKRIQVVFEDETKSSGLVSHKLEIATMPIQDSLDFHRADCVILLDTNRFDKVTRGGKTELLSFIAQHDIKTIVIDHHERKGEDKFAVRIQNPAIPAATQIVYQICFQKLSLLRPPNIEQLTMLGIVDDSGVFTYDYDYSNTFVIVNELIKRGATVSRAAVVINKLDIAQMPIVGELAKNMKAEAEYVYSFISDKFMEKILNDKYDSIGFKAACTSFGNRYISAINDKKWGFIVYPNPYGLNGEYRASFRSRVDSERDIMIITNILGSNGGHMHAAGANIKAPNMQAALRKIKRAILSL